MVDDSGDHARAYGVTFGPLKRALREHRYPVSAAELIEQYGGFELETATGNERLETALEGTETARFGEPWEVRDAILDGLDDGAVRGRAARADESGDDPTEVDAAGDWSRLESEE
ncbi:DUF5789 family protein [Halorubrum pallidum]